MNFRGVVAYHEQFDSHSVHIDLRPSPAKSFDRGFAQGHALKVLTLMFSGIIDNPCQAISPYCLKNEGRHYVQGRR
ncbi:MAG TPA: hypothetical protein VIT23_13600 [Terrimicrobiaceae bacterium]